MKNRKTTRNALRIIDRQIGSDQELCEMIERETVNACVAQLIYDVRKNAGLSQRELAKLIGTSQSTIVRLEDADYEGHSLTMLARIAAALGKHVDIKLVEGVTQTGVSCDHEKPDREAPERELASAQQAGSINRKS